MSDGGKQPSNYIDYFGADATPLQNFYSVQKQHDLQRQQEEKTLQARKQAQALVSSQMQMRAKEEARTRGVDESGRPVIRGVMRRIEDDEEYRSFLSSLPKCDLHPVKPSQNCRKCRKNKDAASKRAQEILAERQKHDQYTVFTCKDVVMPNQNQSKGDGNGTETGGKREFAPLQTYGDPTTCNMNELLRNNIVTSQYFGELMALSSWEEIVAQIEYHCKHAEPFTLGTNNIPSTLFCCLYRLMLMRLSEFQVNNLLTSPHPYTRCTGALYVRYLARPDELWRRLSPYLLDEQEFAPNADAEARSTFGLYIEGLLSDLNYYGTRLPRSPILIEKDIRRKLALCEKKRERMAFNKENYNLLTKDAECYCLSGKDYVWRCGIIMEPEANMKFVKVKLVSADGSSSDSEEIVDLDLGSIILVSENNNT